jgi:hypothetical protein
MEYSSLVCFDYNYNNLSKIWSFERTWLFWQIYIADMIFYNVHLYDQLSQPNFNQNEVGVTKQLVCNPPPPTHHHKLLDHFQTT